MNLEDHVTSFESSKRLKKLGVKQESIFYWEEKHDLTARIVFCAQIDEYDKCRWKNILFSAFISSELGFLIKECREKHFEQTRINQITDKECNERASFLISVIGKKTSDAQK